MHTVFSRDRRRLVLTSLAAASLGILGWLGYRQRHAPLSDMARAAPFVLPKERWTAEHYFNFLIALPPRGMLTLKRALGLVGKEDGEDKLAGLPQDARDIQEETLWRYSNVVTYIWNDATELDYHDVVAWVSGKAGIPKTMIESSSTFELERELHKLLFAKVWDKLSNSQRAALLKEIDPNGALKDKAAIVSLSGASALAALSTSAALSGFAFYTGMSSAIFSAAAVAGVTLPFPVYSGAATAVGFLTGPIGWAVTAGAALFGFLLAGRANVQETTALVMQIHALKVEALIAAGATEAELFPR